MRYVLCGSMRWAPRAFYGFLRSKMCVCYESHSLSKKRCAIATLQCFRGRKGAHRPRVPELLKGRRGSGKEAPRFSIQWQKRSSLQRKIGKVSAQLLAKWGLLGGHAALKVQSGTARDPARQPGRFFDPAGVESRLCVNPKPRSPFSYLYCSLSNFLFRGGLF